MLIGWEVFLAWELVGFAMLVCGTLVYNEIVILPFEAFRKNTKAELVKESKVELVERGSNLPRVSQPYYLRLS